MIRLIDVFKSVLLCLVFIISLRFIDTHIEFLKQASKSFHKTSQAKCKIAFMTTLTLLLIAVVYNYECRNSPTGSIGLLECIYINPNQ